MYKYVDQKDSAAMLAIKRLVGIAPEVNVRDPLHASGKAQQWEINPGFETQGLCNKKSKSGVSVAPQKGLLSFNIFFKKIYIPVER